MDHISYSQYNTYSQCPRSWYLGKVVQAEEKQTWYLLVGTVVHAAIEAHLKGDPFDLESEFYALVRKQRKVEPDLSKWLSGGPKDDPTVRGKALQLAKDCFEQAVEYLQDVDVWEIEYDATGRLPGLDIPVKAYIDIIGEHKKHGPSIIDWKTGRNKPKTNFQLETYAALLLNNPFDHPWYCAGEWPTFTGLWAMLAPGTSKARPVDLSSVSPKDVGAKYQAVYERMVGKHYETKASYDCRFCFHQDNCLLQAGRTDRALHYDKAEEDGFPF